MTKTREVDFSKGKEANIYGGLGLENEIKKKKLMFLKKGEQMFNSGGWALVLKWNKMGLTAT